MGQTCGHENSAETDKDYRQHAVPIDKRGRWKLEREQIPDHAVIVRRLVNK